MEYAVSSTHQHWHLLHFDRYELRRVGNARKVVRDRKTGFCLGDRYAVRPVRCRSRRRQGLPNELRTQEHDAARGAGRDFRRLRRRLQALPRRSVALARRPQGRSLRAGPSRECRSEPARAVVLEQRGVAAAGAAFEARRAGHPHPSRLSPLGSLPASRCRRPRGRAVHAGRSRSGGLARRLGRPPVELHRPVRRERACRVVEPDRRAAAGRSRRRHSRRRHRHRVRGPRHVPPVVGSRRDALRAGLRLRRRRSVPVRPQRPRHARRVDDRRADEQCVRAYGTRVRSADHADPRARPERCRLPRSDREGDPLRGRPRREDHQPQPQLRSARDRGRATGAARRDRLRDQAREPRRRGRGQRVGRHGRLPRHAGRRRSPSARQPRTAASRGTRTSAEVSTSSPRAAATTQTWPTTPPAGPAAPAGRSTR